MRLPRFLSILVALLIALALSPVIATPAHADPVPAPYSGSTHGDILSVSAQAAGVDLTNLAVAHSATATDSTATPRTHAESANLDAVVAGVPILLNADEANAGPVTPIDTYNNTFGEVDVTGILDTGIISGSGTARWAGDTACVPDGTPLAQSSTTLASASVGIPALTIASLGTVTTSGNTTLNAGSVVSTATGNLTSVFLVNGRVEVRVLSTPEITATSDGTTGSVTTNPYAVEVYLDGTLVATLSAGGTLSQVISVGALTVTLDIAVGSLNDTSSGATGSGTLTFLSIDTLVTAPILGTVADVSLNLLPLSASATAPVGGVECVLAPPVITSPLDGDYTTATPTITGTGLAGATVAVFIDGVQVDTAVVDVGGNWSLPLATPLAAGPHTVVATQTLDGLASGLSNAETFIVAAVPVITAPGAGDITTPTPTVAGTGEPGAALEVFIDAVSQGTVTVGSGGLWSLAVTAPLAPGGHTADAQQTIGGIVLDAAPVDFVVSVIPAPVITSPVDGSTTTDTTPSISGTGVPAAAVTVTTDGGTVLGTATVGPDGTWVLVSVELPLGQHTITAAQNVGGVDSPASEPVTFEIVAVDTPVITAPEDGSTTDDNTPTIEGTGQAGADIEVLIDGESVGTVTVKADGTWTLQLTQRLADGEHTVEAIQTDVNDDVSEAEPVTFVVDTLDAPVITSPEDGSTTGDSTPTVRGAGRAGATVTVFVDGAPVGTAVVTPDGTWTLELADALSCEEHTVTATQTEAGSTSAVSVPVRFTVTCDNTAGGLADTGAPEGLQLIPFLALALIGAGAHLMRRRPAVSV